MTERTVIVLSPYFPPSTLAGVHRARHLARHLPAAGWHPVVLCVDEAWHEERLDPGLARLVPPTAEIVKVGAAAAQLTGLAGIRDIGVRAWLPLRQALVRLLRTRPARAVLITGSPYYPMLLAPMVKRDFGLPVVLDFQDPWVSAWGAARPGLSKAGLSHRLAVLLEPRALRGAAFVTGVSDAQNRAMAARYPWLDRARMAAIPIGGDPDDFAALSAADAVADIGDGPPSISLNYVGTFLPRAGPLVRALMRSFARLRATEPALAARIRLNFIGTSNRTSDAADHPVRAIAEAEGVAEAVREFPPRVPYLQALGVLVRSHGVLLIGSDEPHYSASKIYPALMCGRPFLSLFHHASSAHTILSEAGGGCAFAFATEGELAALEPGIADGLRRLALAPDSLGSPNPSAYELCQARNVAARFAAIFDRLDAERPA